MFIVQFLNDEMHNYVKQNIIVHFIIQKLKNKYIFLKNIQTEEAEEPTPHFDGMRGNKSRIFRTLVFPHFLGSVCHSGLDLDLE